MVNPKNEDEKKEEPRRAMVSIKSKIKQHNWQCEIEVEEKEEPRRATASIKSNVQQTGYVSKIEVESHQARRQLKHGRVDLSRICKG